MTFQPTCAPTNEEAPRETPPDEIEVSLSFSLSLSPYLSLSLRFYLSLSVSTSLSFLSPPFTFFPFLSSSLSLQPLIRVRARRNMSL
jgi:hypothetical protein